MSSIKFNYLTKEIELEGSESFIESNFDKIQDLITKSLGVKRMMVSRMTEIKQEPTLAEKTKESQIDTEIKGRELSEVSQLSPSAKSPISEFSNEVRVNRPPLRKYIRKVGMPGQERIVVEVAEQKPKSISLESLKDKFGLSDSKIGGIIRDAEKFGKIKRVMNGSYVWSQD
jgi:hypothetical protein